MKWSKNIVCFLLVAILTACGNKNAVQNEGDMENDMNVQVNAELCPQCSAKVDYSTQAFCSNCGMAFSSMRPDGYQEVDVYEEEMEHTVYQVKEIADFVGDSYLSRLLEYDANDRLIQEISYNDDGESEGYISYFYEDDFLVKKEVYGRNGYLENKTEYTYDELGHILEEVTSDNAGSVLQTTLYTFFAPGYDDNGIYYEEYSFTVYDDDGELYGEGMGSYNEAGDEEFKVLWVYRRSGGIKTYIDRNVYDEGRLIESHSVTLIEEGSDDFRYYEYRYNEDGTLHAEVRHEYIMESDVNNPVETLIYDFATWHDHIKADYDTGSYVYER